MIQLSKSDARRLLVRHHFAPTTVQGVFERLGSVQYDPLQPVGQNHDLVLQARVPWYTIGGWQQPAYRDRLLYDAWDKQASLVMMRDYPLRRIYHHWHAPSWREAILDRYPEAVQRVLDELQERGPLSSTGFHFQEHRRQWEGSWYGPKLTKNILRALWHTGLVHTTRRDGNRHVYDLAERVIPPELFLAEAIPHEKSIDWLILLRHRAMGLLRPNAEAALWSLGISSAERRSRLLELRQRGELVPVEIEGESYHALSRTMELLESQPPAAEPVMRFLAPLDQLMWDRSAIARLFDFDYVWEVYKPAGIRRWGYYVLPVMLDDRFVARIDSNLVNGCWQIHSWRWEDGVELTPGLLGAVEQAVSRFRSYLGADTLQLPSGLRRAFRSAFQAGFRNGSP